MMSTLPLTSCPVHAKQPRHHAENQRTQMERQGCESRDWKGCWRAFVVVAIELRRIDTIPSQSTYKQHNERLKDWKEAANSVGRIPDKDAVDTGHANGAAGGLLVRRRNVVCKQTKETISKGCRRVLQWTWFVREFEGLRSFAEG